MKRVLIGLALFLLLLVPGLWIIALPGDMVVKRIEDSIATKDLSVGIMGFQKGWFYDFTVESVLVSVGGEHVASIENVSGRISLPRLLLMDLYTSFKGRLWGGALSGAASAGRGGRHARVVLDGGGIGRIRALETYGIKGDGRLSAEFDFNDPRGELKVSVTDLELKDAVISGVPLPLSAFEKGNGLIIMEGNNIAVESLNIEGNGLYARIKGSLKGKRLDMTLELMPDGKLYPETLISAVAGKYRVSPGYYKIPLRTNL